MKSDELVVSNIPWLCKVCKNMKLDLKSISSSIVELKNSNEMCLASVEDRLLQLESSVRDTVKSEMNSAKNEIAESVKKEIAETVESMVERRMEELEDRKNRSPNVVMFKK